MSIRPATYMMSGARLKEERPGILEIKPHTPAWITPVVSGGLFAFLGIFLLLSGGNSILLGVIGLSLAVVLLASYPMSVKSTFDLVGQKLDFTADYLFRIPRHIQIQEPLSNIARVGFRPFYWNKKAWVEILLADGNRLMLEFGKHATEAERLVNGLQALAEASTASVLNEPTVVQEAVIAETQSLMQRELRSWSIWLLILGVAQMFAAGGFSPWGILLIGVGLASFYFREAPMFIVYATTIVWAGFSNLLYGDVFWKGFAVLQAFLAYQIYRQFQRFQHAESAVAQSAETAAKANRTARLFPWLSMLLGVGALVGFSIMLMGIAGNIFVFHNTTLMDILGWLETISVYAGVLGVATGLASWLSRNPRKSNWLAGLITGGLTLIAEIVIGWLARL